MHSSTDRDPVHSQLQSVLRAIACRKYQTHLKYANKKTKQQQPLNLLPFSLKQSGPVKRFARYRDEAG
ncbi:hypothetical protein J6590_029282 [Homalodisca vitripennis]|nr:hypothetical protein J6590_029282 [Homalodisca vitripennis]